MKLEVNAQISNLFFCSYASKVSENSGYYASVPTFCHTVACRSISLDQTCTEIPDLKSNLSFKVIKLRWSPKVSQNLAILCQFLTI